MAIAERLNGGPDMRAIRFAKLALTSLLAGVVLPLSASAVNLMDQERNIDGLNERNINETFYQVPIPGQDATQFRFELKGYIFGLRMIRSNYSGWYNQTEYAVYSDIKTSGLGALLKKLEIWAVSKGTHDSQGLRPDYHVQQNLDKKSRRVEMIYDDEAKQVDVSIEPPLGSQGVPPATPQERYLADDTLSAILNIMMRGFADKGEVCKGTVRVFDSKQHYGLRMERDGTRRLKFDDYKSETISCDVYYEPISGFDPEDLPEDEESSQPVNVYFKHYPELGLYIPIRFTYKISAITAVLKVDEMEYVLPGDEVIHYASE